MVQTLVSFRKLQLDWVYVICNELLCTLSGTGIENKTCFIEYFTVICQSENEVWICKGIDFDYSCAVFTLILNLRMKWDYDQAYDPE